MPTEGINERSASSTPGGRAPRGLSRVAAVIGALGFTVLLSLNAQGNNAQRAIEQLENCSAQERSGGNCVRILKRESASNGRQRIKAQLRGGRIIWYVYDKQSGSARRAN
ncbi:MAG: hypothetical protein AAGA91_12985 [Pseudomonadota bacterium]